MYMTTHHTHAISYVVRGVWHFTTNISSPALLVPEPFSRQETGKSCRPRKFIRRCIIGIFAEIIRGGWRYLGFGRYFPLPQRQASTMVCNMLLTYSSHLISVCSYQ